MSKVSAYSLAAHLLNRQNYKEEIIEDFEPWLELSQHCHEILLYQIPKDPNISSKCKFVDDVEFTYQFIHPAIAHTYKYTYSDKFSISYIGNKNSLFAKAFRNGRLSNTKKQIVLIGVASALKYLENKGVSHYCLDVNHIIFDKMQFPKLVCSGIPSVFKPDDWEDESSAIQSFGKFAQTILSDQTIPTDVQTIVDRCIDGNDPPTFDEILSTVSKKGNYLNGVEEATIHKYIMWLNFQDKFPCDYFFELDPTKSEFLFDALETPKDDDDDIRYRRKNDSEDTISEKLFKGQGGYPKDLFGALYLADLDSWRNEKILKSFIKYHGFPEWLKNLNSHNKQFFNKIDEDNEEVAFNPNSEFHIEDEKNRSKLESTDNNDILFVINSYLKGSNKFPKSEQAAFYHVKKLLKKNENNSLLLIELGKMYENGIGTPTNYKKAIHYFKLASNLDSEANQHLQRVRSEQDELEDQISNLNEDCKEKLAKANSNNFKQTMYVAFSFLHGFNGFPKSQYHAIQYYKKAAETDPYVFCMLGNLFRIGIAFSQNFHKAGKFYTLSNMRGCLRGRFYDGFMQMRNYYPLVSSKKHLKNLDKYFFDYKNQQGKSNPFNYCKMIHASQQHFPILFNFYIDAKSKFRDYGHTDGVDTRRQNDASYIKQSINSTTDIENHEDNEDRILNDTEIQITIWFTLYQLKVSIDEGLFLKDMKPSVSLFKDPNYFFAITDYGRLYSWRKDKTSQHLLYKEFKKSIPERLKQSIKEQSKKKMTIEESLSYYENNMVGDKVDKNEFESFVRKCKDFVPLDSAKILISEKVENAESGDKDSLQECARNYFFGYDSFPINYRESFRFYRILSEDSFNDSNAQMWLGIMLSKGIGTKQDIPEALKWFKKASDQDNVEAKLNYALFLEYYNQKIKDPDDPYIPYMNLLSKCIEAHYPQAFFEMGKLKESHVSWEYGRTKSIKYYQNSSHLGHIESTRRLYHVYKKLGMKKELKSLLPFLKTINDPKYIYIYAKALYDIKDYESSINYTKMMLTTKDAKFRKLYADHLLYGYGIEKDVDTAKKFYIVACKKYPKAVVSLANIYAKGIDCDQDLLKARKIYCEAINSVSYSAEAAYRKLYCDFCEKHGYYKAAYNFQLKIAKDKKVKESQYKVAMSLLDPVHKECKKNIKKGIAFLTLSADQHYPIAAYELGKSYIYGKYKLKRDFEQGVDYLKLASNLNYVEATYLLGKIFYYGIGTIPNNEYANDYFNKAASKDHPGAKYYFSLNESLDYDKSHKYLVESAEQGFAKAQFKYGAELIESSLDQEDEDYQTGLEYVKKAVSQDDKDAKSYYEKLTSKNSKRLSSKNSH